MAVTAQMICNVRGSDRLAIDLDGTVRDARANPVDIEVEDISASGLRMTSMADLPVGEIITIGLAGMGMQPAVVVRREGQTFGCRFIKPVPQDYIEQLHAGAPETVTPFLLTHDHMLPPESAVEDSRPPVGARLLLVAGLGMLCWAGLIGIGALLL